VVELEKLLILIRCSLDLFHRWKGLGGIMKKENLLKSIEKLRKKLNELMDPDG
jgi:hypothetical protein